MSDPVTSPTGAAQLPTDHPRIREVHAEGRVFSSILEAARELGITPDTVRSRIKREVASYAFGGARKPQPGGSTRLHGRPVVIAGVRYATMKAAAAQLNTNTSEIRRKIMQGIVGYWYEDEGQRLDSRRDIRRPIFADGKPYESIAAAARDLRLTRPTVHARIKSERFPDYFYQK
ncbi:hypothetical protein NOVOSPHI9U_210044 [Novosphingobium sp. 9U]|nr:hypothetical protein NOVOSPHI9U_210044 [Novosphingobium sp. 9U]